MFISAHTYNRKQKHGRIRGRMATNFSSHGGAAKQEYTSKTGPAVFGQVSKDEGC
jgi:hypothetical protein